VVLTPRRFSGRLLPAVGAVVASALLAVHAQGAAQGFGTIRGRVSVPEVSASLARPMTMLMAGSSMDIDRRTVVVSLDDTPALVAMADRNPARARMDQRGEQFSPRVLAVSIGTTVEFPNNDKTFHDVFSLSRVKTFDLGRYPPGKTGSVKFDTPGIVPVFCDIHTHMSGYILVFAHPFFSVSDEVGRYEIPNVPAGAYTVRVWSEVGTAAPRQAVVTDGAVVSVDFQVGQER
jgi:plastocyanin